MRPDPSWICLAMTTGQRVNSWIDNLHQIAARLLDLPLFMLLLFATLTVALMTFVAWRVGRANNRKRLLRILIASQALLLVCAGALAIDRKIAKLQDSLTEVRFRTSVEAMARVDELNKLQREDNEEREQLFFDLPKATNALTARFGQVEVSAIVYDRVTDVAQLHIAKPLIQAYLAVIDLENPSLQIKVGGSLKKKSLTSAFARENDCTLAINGEAGMSADANSGLGEWHGNLVEQGQTILREDENNPRPFLSFDRQNLAHFTSASATQRALRSDGFNVIWGRADAIVNGVVPNTPDNDRQPRTAMAIDQSGTHLYLLVVDGRQPRYSTGCTEAEVGEILSAFGAYNGMTCDEGGSSCVYFKQFGGITNIPSDNRGQERATYTHFGIALRHG
jgi:hypothetical protein